MKLSKQHESFHPFIITQKNGTMKVPWSFTIKIQQKKVGFTASKKVGNAIKRNLAKRRLRAIFLEIQHTLSDGVYVFVAKEKINHLPYDTLKKVFYGQ